MGKIYSGFTGSSEICKNPGYRYTSSIPSKYQKVVIRKEEKKGFSSQTKRFTSQDCLNENPGPGTYGSIASAEVDSPSFSKKGTAGLASKAARVPRHPQRGNPGPNAYNLQSSLINKHSFGRGASRTFRLPVAQQLDGPKYETPAPNHYNVRYDGIERNSLATASSVFLSKTTRSSFCPNRMKMPSPCHYKVNDTIIQRCPKAAMSPFKSRTPRFPTPVVSCVPGPGAYSPFHTPEPVKRTVIRRRHYLAISAPPLIAPQNPPSPGPGQYDLVDYEGPSKHLMSSAAFVSGTRRVPVFLQGQGGPGPGSYEPQMSSKRSFLYNNSKIWIPA